MSPITLILEPESHTGTVLDYRVTRDGIVLRCELPLELRALPIGERLTTRLQRTETSPGMAAEARVLFQGKQDQEMVCELLYGTNLIPIIDSILDPRQGLRVQPKASAPVRAEVVGEAGFAEMEVYDLSAGGLSLLVSPEEQHKLTDWKMEVRLSLPRQSLPIELQCQVKHRKLQGSSVQYGMSFDAGATDAFEEKERAILDYIKKREQELLRERTDRRCA